MTSETVEQVDTFKTDVSNYCDFCNIGYTQLTHLNVDSMNISEKEKDKIREMQKDEQNPHQRFSVCMEAFDKLSINWNGDVTLCCHDYDNYMIIGNILDMDLKELFLSKAADQYRKMLAENQNKKIYICSTCYETVPMAK